MALVKGLLHRMQGCAVRRKPLDGRHIVTLGLDREHKARTHWRAIEKDRAAAAHAVLTPYVGPGQAEVVAQVIREQPARILRRWVSYAVDLHAARTRWARTRTRCSRNSGVASRSPLG